MDLTRLDELPQLIVPLLTSLVLAHGPALALTLAGAFACLLLTRPLAAWIRIRAWQRDAHLIDILPPPQSELAGAIALWTQMLGVLRPWWKRILLGQPHLVWEYQMTVHGLRIRLWVPGSLPVGLVERAVRSAWPGVGTTIRPTGTRDHAAGVHGGRIRLARPDHYPIQTDYKEDPLRALIGAAGDLTSGDEILVQVAVRPATGRRLRRANRAAAALRHNHTPRSSAFDAITPGGHASAALLALRPEVGREIQAILTKSTQPRLETHVRYLIASAGEAEADRQRRRGRAHAIAASFATYSGHNYYRRRRTLTPHTARWLTATRYMADGDLLSARELAAVAHLPLDETVPGLLRAPARPTAPPPQVAVDGPDARLLGRADQAEYRTIAQLASDGRQHTHIIGGTGSGKTTLMLGMALDDIIKGRGLVMIEPKGESDLLLSRMPEEAMDRVILIDPDDNDPPPSLNLLAGRDPVRTSDTITATFAKIFHDSWGPRTDDILRSCCLTMSGAPEGSIANIPKLLEVESFRRRNTAHIPPTSALAGFWNWYESLSDSHRAAATAPLLNKVRTVLLRDFARDLLATQTRGLDLTALLDRRAIIIARLPKGILGEDTASLIGSLLVGQVWHAILARARHPEHSRVDTGIYIDEVQNFLRLPYGVDDVLAEARAYRAGLVLAHQDLAQLPKDLRSAISANARSKIFFSVSPEDARDLKRHVFPELGEHDLSHLDRFQAAARLVAHGGLSPAFTLRTRPLPYPIEGRATAVRKAARHNARQETP